ncbi:MAG: hypothetical protein AW09_002180 [Candidatus Accumulibacter phosphatis]|uniref:Uncharacterized protein n=1 Tax=Candidatus Accumulibacter phosphatis TaxID=327160 RepID=A0A080LXR2_9PROT|nr:MAG: hypothetical protein AW09_002180 [Candidatus Accumulibacter phosphatis]
MLAVGRQDVQIDFGARIVPAKDHAQLAVRLLGMVFIKLQTATSAAWGDDLDTVAAWPEGPGFDEAPLRIGVQRHVDAVDNQSAGRAILARLPQLSFDQGAIFLSTTIDRRFRVSRDDRRFLVFGETAVTPAAARRVEDDAGVGSGGCGGNEQQRYGDSTLAGPGDHGMSSRVRAVRSMKSSSRPRGWLARAKCRYS